MIHHQEPKCIAVTFPIAVPWMARCVRGIAAYAQEHGGWDLFTSPPALNGAQEWNLTVGDLKGWPGDGVVALISDSTEIRDAQRLGIPVVNISGTLQHSHLPSVISDQCAIGRLGAEHLLSCGFRNLAFYGLQGPWYTLQRRRGFESRARESGIECSCFEEPPSPQSVVSWQKRLKPLGSWLKSLKTPVGIMAVHDYRASVLLEECRFLKLNVPHEVAILGVDDNTLVCENHQPTLSSISRNPWRTGYEAARMLDQLMAGKTLEEQEIVIPPDGVTMRRSTDTIAVDNPHVSIVARYLHDNLSQNLTIEYVLKQVPISRRLLERLFRRHLGCTPHEYLSRLRVEKAKALLSETHRKKIQVIAKDCGFATADRLRLAFEQVTGVTPTQYCQNRLRDNDPRSKAESG